jgi:hypothetical protein
MWASLALAGAAFLALVGWAVTYRSVGHDVRADIVWEGWAFAFATVASLVIAAAAFALNRLVADELTRSRDDILQDMLEIHLPAGTQAPG